MKWPILTCPFCSGRLPNTELHLRPPFVCPTCSEKLQYQTRQLHVSAAISLGLTVAACYLFGLRGLRLFGAVILLWFPISLVWEFIFVRIVPTRFERYQRPEKYTGLHLDE